MQRLAKGNFIPKFPPIIYIDADDNLRLTSPFDQSSDRP